MKLNEYKKTNENMPINIFISDVPFYSQIMMNRRAYSGMLKDAPDYLNDYEILHENVNPWSGNKNLCIYKQTI